MHLGIDLGTTRTVVAYTDRGNYPVVTFTDPSGDVHEFFPSLLALKDDQILTGFEALEAGQQGATTLRSLKRHFANAGLESTIDFGSQQMRVCDLARIYLEGLMAALYKDSSICEQLAAESIESTVIAVPAHAASTQRFITLDAFRQAGFPVSAIVNEPSAAGFEYTHRRASSITSKRNRVLVYDLGGGTFDASRIDVEDLSHRVLDTVGLNQIGGDDFDAVLADLALTAVGNPELTKAQRQELVLDAQTAKEGLAPQSKRIAIEVGDSTAIVRVDDFYEAITDMIDETIDAMAGLVEALDEVAGIYLVGGASSLPIVARRLRLHYARRVQRSPYPGASTAIGLAIAADPNAGYTLSDKVSRGFGVFREWDGGQEAAFDSIFSRDEVLAANGIEKRRTYRPVHNIGCLRFVEYGQLVDWQPVGDLVPFATVRFPYDPALQHSGDLSNIDIHRIGERDTIEETYRIDANGIVSVRITDLTSGFSQVYEVSRLQG